MPPGRPHRDPQEVHQDVAHRPRPVRGPLVREPRQAAAVGSVVTVAERLQRRADDPGRQVPVRDSTPRHRRGAVASAFAADGLFAARAFCLRLAALPIPLAYLPIAINCQFD